MMSRYLRNLILLLALLAVLAPGGEAMADRKGKKHRDGHDEVYEAQRSGRILPLAEILLRLRPVTGEEILDVEYDVRDSVPTYEIKYVDKRGRRREVYVDARNAAILKQEAD
ncbi:MAG: PepSY domain-containing protein [Rhizobiaceae bacterium]